MQSELVHIVMADIEGSFDKPTEVWHEFLVLLNRLYGVTVLATQYHLFPNNGMSGVAIIGESHAAIHTWPERGKAWVELATCGSETTMREFIQEIRLLYKIHSMWSDIHLDNRTAMGD